MAGRDRARADRLAHEVAGALLGFEIDARRRAGLHAFDALDFAQPERLAKIALSLADQQDDVAQAPEADGAHPLDIGQDADAADHRRGRIAEPPPVALLSL